MNLKKFLFVLGAILACLIGSSVRAENGEILNETISPDDSLIQTRLFRPKPANVPFDPEVQVLTQVHINNFQTAIGTGINDIILTVNPAGDFLIAYWVNQDVGWVNPITREQMRCGQSVLKDDPTGVRVTPMYLVDCRSTGTLFDHLTSADVYSDGSPMWNTAQYKFMYPASQGGGVLFDYFLGHFYYNNGSVLLYNQAADDQPQVWFPDANRYTLNWPTSSVMRYRLDDLIPTDRAHVLENFYFPGQSDVNPANSNRPLWDSATKTLLFNKTIDNLNFKHFSNYPTGRASNIQGSAVNSFASYLNGEPLMARLSDQDYSVVIRYPDQGALPGLTRNFFTRVRTRNRAVGDAPYTAPTIAAVAVSEVGAPHGFKVKDDTVGPYCGYVNLIDNLSWPITAFSPFDGLVRFSSSIGARAIYSVADFGNPPVYGCGPTYPDPLYFDNVVLNQVQNVWLSSDFSLTTYSVIQRRRNTLLNNTAPAPAGNLELHQELIPAGLLLSWNAIADGQYFAVYSKDINQKSAGWKLEHLTSHPVLDSVGSTNGQLFTYTVPMGSLIASGARMYQVVALSK